MLVCGGYSGTWVTPLLSVGLCRTHSLHSSSFRSWQTPGPWRLVLASGRRVAKRSHSSTVGAPRACAPWCCGRSLGALLRSSVRVLGHLSQLLQGRARPSESVLGSPGRWTRSHASPPTGLGEPAVLALQGRGYPRPFPSPDTPSPSAFSQTTWLCVRSPLASLPHLPTRPQRTVGLASGYAQGLWGQTPGLGCCFSRPVINVSVLVCKGQNKYRLHRVISKQR